MSIIMTVIVTQHLKPQSTKVHYYDYHLVIIQHLKPQDTKVHYYDYHLDITQHLELVLPGKLAGDFLVGLLQQPQHALRLLVLMWRQLLQRARADVHHSDGPALVVTQREGQVAVAVCICCYRL